MLSNSFGLIVYQAVNLYISYYLAVELSVEDFGNFQFYLSASFFLVMVLKLGLDEGVIYVLPKLSEESKYILLWNIVFIYSLVITFFSLVLYILNTLNIATLISADYIFIYILSLSFFIQTLFSAFLRVTGKVRSRVIAIYFLAPISFLFFLLQADGLNNVLLSRVASFLIASVFLIGVYYKNAKQHFLFRIDPSIIDILRTSVGIFILQLFASGIEQSYVAIFVLKYFASEAELGLYSFAIRLSALVAMIIIVFNGFFVPILVSLLSKYEERKDAFLNAYVVSSKVLRYFGCLAVVIIYTLSYDVINFINPEYIGALVLIKVLLFGHLSTIYFGINVPIIISVNKKLEFYTVTLSCILAIILSILLYQYLGVIGIGISIFISQLTLNYSRFMLVKNKLKINEVDRYKYLPIVITLLVLYAFEFFDINEYFGFIQKVMLLIFSSFAMIYFTRDKLTNLMRVKL